MYMSQFSPILLTITTLRAHSADEKLVIFFVFVFFCLFFFENRLWPFICNEDNWYEISKLVKYRRMKFLLRFLSAKIWWRFLMLIGLWNIFWEWDKYVFRPFDLRLISRPQYYLCVLLMLIQLLPVVLKLSAKKTVWTKCQTLFLIKILTILRCIIYNKTKYLDV